MTQRLSRTLQKQSKTIPDRRTIVYTPLLVLNQTGDTMTTASQKMSLTGAILMNINLMVGASAFLSPGVMTKYAGSASFYGWLFAGALFFPIVWCIAQITRYFPGQGSFYSYSSNTISRSAGFMSGWLYFLGYVSIGSLQLASLTNIVAHNFNIPFLTAMPALCGCLLVMVLGAISLRSIGIIDRIQSMATLYKLVPLFLGITALLFYFSPSTTPGIFNSSPLILIPTIPMAIFGFWGFEGVCSISHLIEDSKTNAPKAIFMGFIFTVLIYTLFHLSLLAIMGSEALSTHGAIGFVNYLTISSPFMLQFLNALVMSAIIVAHVNAIFGGIVANSAMLCAMAEEKIVFMSSFFAHRLPDTGRPVGAIIAHCLGIIFCITVVGNMQVLNAMANLGVLIAFVFTIVALFIQARRQVVTTLACVLGLASCAVLSFYSWIGIGANDAARLVAIAPMLATLVAGYAMYIYSTSCNTARCR